MIHSIRIKNFKSIRDVSVNLSPITVFVGRSGTGKSNFFDAMSALKKLVVQTSAQIAQTTWPSHLGNDPCFFFNCEFSVGVAIERFNYLLSRTQTINSRGQKIWDFEERLSLDGVVLFHHKSNEQGISEWKHAPDVMNPPKPNGAVLGKLPAMSEAVIAFTTLTNGIGFYDFSDTVLMKNKGGNEQGLNSDASNFLSALQTISQDLNDVGLKKSLVAILNRVNPTIASVELDSIQSPSSVIVAHRFHEDSKLEQLSLSQESAGVRRFYAHLLALYQKPPKQTLMFEHPEDGIHPGAMSLLAGEFKDASEDDRGQVLLTTHNPMLLDHFTADQIRAVELVNSETVIGPIDEAQQEAIRQDLLDAGELLTTDPARVQKECTK